MKLSIITINRNNAEGLRKTIESVVSQTFTDYEYIVIDGVSTDGSVDIIKQHTDKINYWVSEPDSGIYNAMNKGVLKAKGEYLLFLNSGDILAARNTLATVIVNMEDGVDILSGYVREKNDGGKDKYPPENFTFRYLYYKNIPHQAEFIRRELLVAFGLYNENFMILSDNEFNVKALMNNANYRYIDVLVAYVDTTGVSCTAANNHIMSEERKRILEFNIPFGIMKDYEYFFLREKDFHPALLWLKENKFMFKILRFVYNKFSQRK